MKYFLALLLVVTVSIGGYFWYAQQPPKYIGPVDKIRLGMPSLGLEIAGLILIAEDQGYFTKQGLDVVITTPPSTLQLQQELSEGKLDFVVASDFSFVSNILSKDPMKAKIIATIDKANWFDVVGKKNKGINKPADLKGKTVAVFKKTALEYFLGEFLAFNNLTPLDVKLVDLPPDKALDAITSDKIDAAVINNPFTSQIKKVLAQNAVSLYVFEEYGIYNYLVFSSDEFIKNHPEAIERFLYALVQAEEYVQKKPNESQDILAKKLNVEKTYLASIWKQHRYLISLDQSLLLMMENQSRWRIGNKLTNKTLVPHFRDYIYSDPLKKVKLEAVTLY